MSKSLPSPTSNTLPLTRERRPGFPHFIELSKSFFSSQLVKSVSWSPGYIPEQSNFCQTPEQPEIADVPSVSKQYFWNSFY